MLTAEDDPEDTLVPRLVAAGADLNQVEILKMVRDKGKSRKFSLEADMETLTAACKALGNVVLIVIDPVSSYMGGKIDGRTNTAVRHVLDPLSDLAAELRCAILSITHFRKGAEGPKAVHRIMDSIAFGAAPRATFGIYSDPTDMGEVGDTEPRVMLLFKTNLPDKAKGLKYHIVETTGGTDTRRAKPVPIKTLRIQWDGETDLTADTEQRMENEQRSTPRLDEAIRFAEATLADGARITKEVKTEAAAIGIKEDTLRRALDKLGIKARIQEGSSSGPGQPGVWEYPGIGE
jgi:putative DNA primase/helicase